MDSEPTLRRTIGGDRALGLLFVIAAMVLLFFNLGGYRTFGWHEARAVVPAREMLHSGDWTIPRFAGEPRLNKPPLVYWLLAGLGSVTGEIGEFTARVPQAVAALLFCLLMGAWARRWYGREAGWAAVFVQLTSAWLLIWSRKAEIDMTIWLLTTAALYLIATQPDSRWCPDFSRHSGGDSTLERHPAFNAAKDRLKAGHQLERETGRRNFVRWTGVFALVAIAWMGKFHYAAAMVFLPVAVFFVLQKRYRDFWNFANPVGLLLLASAVFVWPLLVLRELPGAWEVWLRETIGRATGELGHKSFWYYLPHLPAYALPWTPFALLAMRTSWRCAWKDGEPRERFLWIWLLTHLAIVTLQPNKHAHYIFSAMPVLTLFASRTLADWLARVRSGEWRMTPKRAYGLSALVTVTMLAAVAIAYRKWPLLIGAILVFAVAVAVGLLGVIALAARKRYASSRLLLLGVFLGGWVVLIGWIVPARDHREVEAAFARRSRASLSAGQSLIVYRLGEHPIVAYLDGRANGTATPDEVASTLRENRPSLIVTYRDRIAEFRGVGRCRIVAVCDRKVGSSPGRSPLVLVEVRKRDERDSRIAFRR